ncbi:MAG: O-antigen ligase family protein [Patescibacteria group bacterium]|nr:O-antigen ligase family protein [Patescibacteria group bacterium]
MDWFNSATFFWVLIIGFLTYKNRKIAMTVLVAAIPLYLLRLQILSIPTTWLELGVYAAVLVELVRLYRLKKVLSWFSSLKKYTIPLSILFVGLVIGVLVSENQISSLGILKGWFIDPILLLLLLVNVFNGNAKEAIRYVFGGLFVSSVILSMIALYQVISGNFITIDNRASSVFVSANYLSLYLAPVFVLGSGLLLTFYKKWQKIIVILGLLLIISAIYFTFSYASWLAIAVGLGMLLLLIKKHWYVIVGVGAAALLAISQMSSVKFLQMFDFSGRSSSHVRLEIWQTAGLMVKENWLTGIGLGQFQDRYVSFAERIFHPPLEFLVLHSHNTFIHFWVTAGLFGFVGYVWFIAKWLKDTYSNAKNNLLGLSILSTMVTMLVHGLFDNAYWKNDLSALFWVVVALGMLISNNGTTKNIQNRN